MGNDELAVSLHAAPRKSAALVEGFLPFLPQALADVR